MALEWSGPSGFQTSAGTAAAEAGSRQINTGLTQAGSIFKGLQSDLEKRNLADFSARLLRPTTLAEFDKDPDLSLDSIRASFGPNINETAAIQALKSRRDELFKADRENLLFGQRQQELLHTRERRDITESREDADRARFEAEVARKEQARLDTEEARSFLRSADTYGTTAAYNNPLYAKIAADMNARYGEGSVSIDPNTGELVPGRDFTPEEAQYLSKLHKEVGIKQYPTPTEVRSQVKQWIKDREEVTGKPVSAEVEDALYEDAKKLTQIQDLSKDGQQRYTLSAEAIQEEYELAKKTIETEKDLLTQAAGPIVPRTREQKVNDLDTFNKNLRSGVYSDTWWDTGNVEGGIDVERAVSNMVIGGIDVPITRIVNGREVTTTERLYPEVYEVEQFLLSESKEAWFNKDRGVDIVKLRERVAKYLQENPDQNSKAVNQRIILNNVAARKLDGLNKIRDQRLSEALQTERTREKIVTPSRNQTTRNIVNNLDTYTQAYLQGRRKLDELVQKATPPAPAEAPGAGTINVAPNTTQTPATPPLSTAPVNNKLQAAAQRVQQGSPVKAPTGAVSLNTSGNSNAIRLLEKVSTPTGDHRLANPPVESKPGVPAEQQLQDNYNYLINKYRVNDGDDQLTIKAKQEGYASELEAFENSRRFQILQSNALVEQLLKNIRDPNVRNEFTDEVFASGPLKLVPQIQKIYDRIIEKHNIRR